MADLWQRYHKTQSIPTFVEICNHTWVDPLVDQLIPAVPQPIGIPDLDVLPVMHTSLPKSTDECRLQLAVSEVQSLDAIKECMDAVLLSERHTPDNLTYAYRFLDANGLKRNYDSGDDAGTGSSLLRMMDNRGMDGYVVVVKTWYKNPNSVNKGKGFFKCIETALDEIIANLDT